VTDVAPIAGVGDDLPEPAREPESLVELPQHHQPCITGDLATLEINDEFSLESEPRSTMTLCSHRRSSSCAIDTSLAAASLAHLGRVGGFFTGSIHE
jgi:hypothetical protein